MQKKTIDHLKTYYDFNYFIFKVLLNLNFKNEIIVYTINDTIKSVYL
jgi:hypothetical protein